MIHTQFVLGGLSLAVVFFLDYCVGRMGWYASLAVIGLSHYYLAFHYSRKRIAGIFANKKRALLSLALVALAVYLYSVDFSLTIIFGIHHVLTEAFFYKYQYRTPPENYRGYFNALKVLIHSLIYITALRFASDFRWISPQILYSALALSIVLFLVFAVFNRREGEGEVLLRDLGIIVIGLVFVFVSQYYRLLFHHFVFYHFFLWILAPLFREVKETRPKLGGYFALTTLTIAGLLWFTQPYLVAPKVFFASWIWKGFMLFSFIHILSSVSLSSLNPRWITNVFSSRPVNVPHN